MKHVRHVTVAGCTIPILARRGLRPFRTARTYPCDRSQSDWRADPNPRRQVVRAAEFQHLPHEILNTLYLLLPFPIHHAAPET